MQVFYDTVINFGSVCVKTRTIKSVHVLILLN